ncbi:MAG: PadR family transcriptional regulator [Thermoleophilaceae bacterium]|nr:PadR family transcriptional regulator [Thermoleophilaceae bacterium]
MADLSSTSYVILGMLSHQARSGYDIKQFVDKSTRHFWAASYGQIYPELKRLADAGLIEGEESPSGERRRTLHRLTAEGRTALHDWLVGGGEPVHEVRDELLLKLFFADGLPPEETLALLETKRALHRATLTQLELQLPAARAARAAQGLVPVPMALDYGIRFHRWAVEWCAETAAELRGEAGAVARPLAGAGTPEATR